MQTQLMHLLRVRSAATHQPTATGRAAHLVGLGILGIAIVGLLAVSSAALAASIDPPSVHKNLITPALRTEEHPEMPLRATALTEIPGKGTYLSFFLEGNVSKAELEASGVIVESTLPNGTMTVDVPVSSLTKVASLPGVKHLSTSNWSRPCSNVSVPGTQATPNYWTSSPPNFTGQAGAGVIIGDVNDGLDVTHDDFKNPDGTTRLLYYWDQTTTGTPPAGYSYGSEYSAAQINSGTVPKKDSDGHGSHCMGVAAGDGSATGNGQPANQFIGMAPRAAIIEVLTDFTNAKIVDGVNYIFQKAAAAGMPAVVNLSLGSNFGPHDGTESFETSLDALTGAGKIIVASAGNDGFQSLHALQLVPSGGGNQTVTFSIPTYTRNLGAGNDFLFIDAFYPGAASMSVSITSPRGTSNVGPVTKGNWSQKLTGSDGAVYLEDGYTAHPGGDNEIFIQIWDYSASSQPRVGTWTITLTPVSGTNPQLDLWVADWQLGYGSTSTQPLFTSDVDEHDTIGQPASAAQVIAAGAYTSKTRWLSIDGNTYNFTDSTHVGSLTAWTSLGPLRSGAQKPDILAPGEAIVAALSTGVSSPTQALVNPDGKHWTNSGTSFSAAHVSGGVGLILADYPTMTPAQIKSKLASDALVDSYTGSVWNYQWGWGKLRMLRSVDTTPPTVTVNAPNGGENWASGSSHNITWTATDNVAVTTIDIGYSTNNGTNWTSVATGLANSGSYSWTVPSTPTTQALVKVTAHDAASNTGNDVSNAVFTISDQTAPSVTVNAPNGGENWATASSHNITWTATDNIGVTTVDIDYSTNNGGSWTSVATGEANDGTYTWTVPVTPTTQALVRVKAYDAATNMGSDVSNAVFTISDQTAPSVTVNAPNGGENWATGSSHNITWTATDPAKTVTTIDIDYSTNNGTSWTSVATGETNDGTYTWTVPSTPTTQALVKVTAHDAASNTGSDVSNAVFTISDQTAPTVTVNVPNGGESWAIGSSHNVTWTATDNIAVTTVDIDYSTNNGGSWISVATGEANDGTYSWTVPATPTTQALVRVKAYDAATNVGSDVSNAVFTIYTATYTITASAGTGGTIDPVGAVVVNAHANQSFAIAADACYNIADVLVDGVSVGAVASYEFTDVTANHTIAASFVLKTYTIAASAGAGGTIDPVGDVVVNCGTAKSFAIAADACYNIADVLVDGVSVGAVASYEFTNVTANHTIAASFVLKTYTVAASAGAGGTIDPAGDVVVNCGSAKSFAIAANACYNIADVLVDGVSVGAVASYEFTNVTANHTIAASFVLKTYTIAASAGAGGTIDPVGDVVVNCGSAKSFAIAADACYNIADVLVDGVSVGAVASYEFTNVTASHTIAASFVLKTYTIAASAGAGGTIDPVGDVVVNCGTAKSFAIAAEACYNVADVLVDGVSVGAVASYEFTNVTANHTIAASFVLKTYTIAASAGAGGTIDPVGDVVVNCGSAKSFAIAADACYNIADVLVDGVSVGAVASYEFTNVTANHTIAASFVLKTYTIAASAGAGGTIDPVGDVVVNCGTAKSFAIAADACYNIADVLVDGVSVGAVASYEFTNVTANHTIAASFVLKTYTIAASAGAGGTIDPVGDVVVNCGSAKSFAITADACYNIADVLVDGVSVGAVASYEFTNVTANHTIAASFVLKTYTIVASAGAGGTIDPAGDVVVNCGSAKSFAIAADACYNIADVLVDGVSVGAVASYEFTNVTANHTIAASFVLKTYTITASAGAGGTIDPVGDVVVNCGSAKSFAITADACYNIADVLVDGVSVGAVASYEFTNVTANHTIAASFVLRTYTIAASAGSGGTIDPVGDVVVNCGTAKSFAIAADACYNIADVLVDGVSVGAVASYEFTNVTVNHTIAASFVLKTYAIAASAGAGGSIDPAGNVVVNCGTAKSFAIAADACYSIADVLVDGVSVGAVASYEFTNVNANHTIAASFVLKTYTIAASAGAGGTIDPVGNVVVNCGSAKSFAIAANACYNIADVLVDGVSVGAVASYEFTNVAANHTIAASFVLKTYTIAASAGSGGTIDPVGDVVVTCGTAKSFAVAADACYNIADVLVDGVSVGAVASYEFTDVTANHTIAASFVLRTYNIAASAGAGGTIDPAGDVVVNCGSAKSFAIAAEPCYNIADVLVDGVSVGAVASYEFTNVTTNHTIAASFVLKTYTIAASAGAGGTIDPTGDVVVNCGTAKSFAIAADACYNIADVLVDGVSVGAVASYEFTNVTANHTIAASFVLRTYTIAASAGAGGTIDPAGDVVVNCGTAKSFAIAADACYNIADVLVDGVSVGAVASYEFTNVTANHTIAASFVLKTYTIAASAGAGGTIDPAGDVVVNCGTAKSFAIAADACYNIADVLVDGVSVGAVASYEFTNVTANHTIAASFVLKTYTIAASAGAGGTIDPVGDVVVNCGSAKSFAIAAEACYNVADVLVDGVSVGAVASYEFTNVTANHTIAASFVLKTYTIAASAGSGGTIDPVGDVVVTCGTAKSFAIAADACYNIADVLVDGVSVGAVASYEFTNVTANHTIAASFVLKTYTIAASAGAGGTIDPVGDVVVNCGSAKSFAIAADACYNIADVLVDGISVGAVASYEFTNVTANHTIAASFVLKTYTIAASAGAGGTIDPAGDVVVNCGTAKSFAIAADACYSIADVLVDGVSVGAVASYEFTNVTANHTIAASFVLKTYTIAASAGAGGTIDPVGDVVVNCGTAKSFAIAADACYNIADVLVDGVSVGAVASYEFTNVTANHTIAASFVLKTYTIAASAGAGGAIDPVGDVVVNCGSSKSFAIAADACYNIADVLVDGVSVGAVASYEFTNVTANHTIAASFVLRTYTIAASAGAGGTIDPVGDVVVNCGSSKSFAIAADACYNIADVLVDGVSVGAVASYEFTNVTANHTIAASFALKTYTIAASAGAGGTIDPVGDVVVNCGAAKSFAIAADACYNIADVLVDGVSVGAVASYEFTNVMANHTIAASFVLKTYTIAASAGAGGTIDPTGDVVVNCGSSKSFAIAADACYNIADVLVDGVSVGAVASYEFTNVTANHTIAASFVLKTYTIAASAGAGGTIDPVGDVVVNCGSSKSFAIAADACYNIADVLVDGVSVGAVASYEFTNVTANHTIAASFVLKTYTIAASAGAGGTIDPVGDVVVNCGSSKSFAIAADACYNIADVLVDGVSVGAVASYEFTNVTANHTIAASFVLKTYTIAASAGAGGTIDPVGDVVVNCGTAKSFAIAADACYSIADVLVDGVSVGAVASYEFTNVTANHTIAASFVLKPYTIAASAGAGGTIDPAGNVVVSCGSAKGFAIAADACYNIADVLVDGVSVGAVASYEFTNVTANHTIAASFVLRTYTIAASAGAGGTIAPAGNVSVPCGGTQGFTVTAGPCYHIADVKVDGISQGPIAGYSFGNVQANHTIEAIFGIDTYALGLPVLEGGFLNAVPVKPLYDCGDSVTITAVAELGWAFDHWTGDAGGSVNPLHLVMDANKTIGAVFVDIAPPTVQVLSPNGGEEWDANTTHAITWTATDNRLVTAIDLAYSTDGGVTYPYVIASGLANSGTYSWLVPATYTKNARVQATAHDAAGHMTLDASDADWEIGGPQSAVAETLLGSGQVTGIYPNPAFAGDVHVLYRVSGSAAVDVSIYDVTGHLVRRLESGSFPVGVRSLVWNGLDENHQRVSSGIYLVRMSGAGTQATKRLVFFR